MIYKTIKLGRQLRVINPHGEATLYAVTALVIMVMVFINAVPLSPVKIAPLVVWYVLFRQHRARLEKGTAAPDQHPPTIT